MMYLYLYCIGRLALMHDPPQRLEACLRFLALLAVTPFPPSPWALGKVVYSVSTKKPIILFGFEAYQQVCLRL